MVNKMRPVLMNAFSINAILKSRKRQTRRVIRPQPGMFFTTFSKLEIFKSVLHAIYKDGAMVRCPYGNVGDRLWVRETWAAERGYNNLAPRDIEGQYASIENVDLWWRADHASDRRLDAKPGKWRPSIFMPRWASRITLEITDIRIERVQDISEADAIVEGVSDARMFLPGEFEVEPAQKKTGLSLPVWRFMHLWNSINGKRGYDWPSNPWVWIIEFKLLKGEQHGKHNHRVV